MTITPAEKISTGKINGEKIDLHSDFVQLIADLTASNDGARTLAAEHGDDGTGYCATCSPAAGSGRTTWPCTLFRISVGAAELQRRRKLA